MPKGKQTAVPQRFTGLAYTRLLEQQRAANPGLTTEQFHTWLQSSANAAAQAAYNAHTGAK